MLDAPEIMEVHMSPLGCLLNYTLEIEHQKMQRQITFCDENAMYDWLSNEWITIKGDHTAWITKIEIEIPVMYEKFIQGKSKLTFIDTTPYDELKEVHEA